MQATKFLLQGLFVLVLAFTGSAAMAQAGVCKGRIFNPVTDVNWTDAFPITVMGVKAGPNRNPPTMFAPPVCVCPSSIGIPMPGIGVTYWEPAYLAEVERTPGCLSTMGGVQVLPQYASEQSEGNWSGASGTKLDEGNRMQVHWYSYPLFSMMNLFTSLICKNSSGFDLQFMTEPDPLWQQDAWGTLLSPEGILFASLPAQAACAIDAGAASTGFSLDHMFWCAGTWGSLYPLTGTVASTYSPFQTNAMALSKYIARSHQFGLLWQTIGPSAVCFSHPNPIWAKGQYRFNQVYPWPRKGPALNIGNPGLLLQPPAANAPGYESSAFVVWQGKQCCLRF